MCFLSGDAFVFGIVAIRILSICVIPPFESRLNPEVWWAGIARVRRVTKYLYFLEQKVYALLATAISKVGTVSSLRSPSPDWYRGTIVFVDSIT